MQVVLFCSVAGPSETDCMQRCALLCRWGMLWCLAQCNPPLGAPSPPPAAQDFVNSKLHELVSRP